MATGRTFTLEEARTLLPVLSSLLTRARETAVRASRFEERMQALSQRIHLSGGLMVDVGAAARQRAEREKALDETRKGIEEIEEIGARVGETEEGTLEFPFALEGRTVLLCWTLGDEEIGHWREEEDEADTRRVLDGRFGRRERPN